MANRRIVALNGAMCAVVDSQDNRDRNKAVYMPRKKCMEVI